MELKKNRAGYLENNTHRECTICGEIFKKRRKGCSITMCKPCNSNRVKSQSTEKKMWFRAKARANKLGIPFDIEIEDIVVPERCPVFGFELKENSGKPGFYKDSPSLDKIDPDKGYTKGNIQVLSGLANLMKAYASEEELLAFADWIYKTYNKADLE